MKKAIIVYASKHHGNTRKLVEAICAQYGVPLINAAEQQRADLSEYDLIGFASGIDFGKFYESVEKFLIKNLPEHKEVFFLYTCAKPGKRFTESVRHAALQKDAAILGEYGCRGYNTYGPWKLIGGMNKQHPTEEEIAYAASFYASLIAKSDKKTDL